MNAHREIKIAKIDIRRVIASLELAPGCHDDEQLKLDMLEGESGFFEIIETLLSANEDDDGNIAALDEQIAARGVRKERAKARIEARKQAIAALMECAGESTVRLPEATLSLRLLAPRPKVNDPDALPDAFVTVQTIRKPDTDAIKAALERGESIPGVSMTNGGSSLSVRRK